MVVEAARGAGAQSDCKHDWLLVRSLFEKMKYLFKFIFPFLRSGVEAKRSVEFGHSMSPEFSGKWGTDFINTSSLCLPCCVRDTSRTA